LSRLTRRQWGPGIIKDGKHNLRRPEQVMCMCGVAWGQATFRRDGNVTPGQYAFMGRCATKVEPSPWPSHATTKQRRSIGRRGRKEKNRLYPHPRSSSSRRSDSGELVVRLLDSDTLSSHSRPGSSSSAATGRDSEKRAARGWTPSCVHRRRHVLEI
jgi:hypothetical protein